MIFQALSRALGLFAHWKCLPFHLTRWDFVPPWKVGIPLPFSSLVFARIIQDKTEGRIPLHSSRKKSELSLRNNQLETRCPCLPRKNTMRAISPLYSGGHQYPSMPYHSLREQTAVALTKKKSIARELVYHPWGAFATHLSLSFVIPNHPERYRRRVDTVYIFYHTDRNK